MAGRQRIHPAVSRTYDSIPRKPKLAFVYLTDMRNRSADVIQTLEMCDALGKVFRVRLYHPAIGRDRARRELDYWDVEGTWELRRLAARGPSRMDWLDYPNRVAFLGQALLDLKLRPVDVIFTRDPSLLYLLDALPAGVRPTAPILYEAHKLYHRVSARVRSPAGEAKATQLARHVIAISPGVREDLLLLGIDARRIDVLPLGVKLQRFAAEMNKPLLKAELGLDPTRSVVAYSGSWEEWKGVETLLDAFVQVARSDAKAVLVLAGVPGATATALKTKLSAAGLSADRFVIHHHLARRDLVRWLCAADIGVVPNGDTVLGARYTSPLKVFEYLAAGLAVVASDVPALRALLSEREALFARPDDAMDMAEKLSELLKSSAERRARQLAARERAADFDYAIRAERILAIYLDHCIRGEAL